MDVIRPSRCPSANAECAACGSLSWIEICFCTDVIVIWNHTLTSCVYDDYPLCHDSIIKSTVQHVVINLGLHAVQEPVHLLSKVVVELFLDARTTVTNRIRGSSNASSIEYLNNDLLGSNCL